MTRPALFVCVLLVLSVAACSGGGSGGGGPDPLPTGGGGTSTPGTGTGTGTGSGSGSGEEPFTWSPLLSNGAPQVTSPDFRVIRTQAEFDAVLALIPNPPWESEVPPSGPPVIDFKEKIVVAVFLGTRPTARYSVRVTNIVRQGDGIHVDYEERVPTGPGCPPDLPPPNQPMALATCTRVEGSATFAGTVAYRNCTNP